MAAASPSLFLFFPGKCDSFLLEGRGVRKGDEREQDGTPILRTCGIEMAQSSNGSNLHSPERMVS